MGKDAMWELGIVTDEIDDDLAKALRLAKEWGMKRVEFRTIWGKGAWNLTPIEKKEALSLLDGEGFEVVGIGAQFLKIPHEFVKIEYDAQIDNLKRAMEAAQIFGAPLVRVLSPLYPAGSPGPGSTGTVTDELVSLYRLPVRLAEKEGVTLGIENQSTTQITTSEHAVRLAEKIDLKAFGILWDPANALAGGEADAFPAGYERVRSRMVHIHLKDAKCTESGRFQWVVMGEGEFDAAGQLRRLKEDGYETTVTLEPHLGSVDKTARAAENLRRMMTEIGM
jgi:sugar phosphate isomerase/epimerase